MTGSDPLPTLDAARVRLRRLSAADVPALFALFSDPVATRYWSHPPFTDVAQADELLRDIDRHAEAGDLLQWGIEARDTRAIVGTVTLAALDRTHRRAEIGFMLAQARWGQGLAREAVECVRDHAVAALGLARLEADVDPRNAASLGLLERMGFEREGYLRARWRIGGEVQDTVLLGWLAPDAVPPDGFVPDAA